MSDSSGPERPAEWQWWTRSTTMAGFAEGCVWLGDGARADQVWTKQEFKSICRQMRNDNPAPRFMLVYRDKNGQANFKMAKTAPLGGRIDWAWNTIIGGVTRKVGIGFYPSNQNRMSRWGAMDFDAHDG